MNAIATIPKRNDNLMKKEAVMRTVLGHHSCPGSMDEIPAHLTKLEKGKPISLVLPPVKPAAEEQLEKILDILNDFQDAEITVNDWGTLARTAEWKRKNAMNVKLIMGILLSGQESDPAIRLFTDYQEEQVLRVGRKAVVYQWEPPPETLVNHWSEPASFHMTEMLRSMGVDIIETGLQPIPVREDTDHLPVRQLSYGLMSVKPCCGECDQCGGKEIRRAGCRVYFDRNMLIWENC